MVISSDWGDRGGLRMGWRIKKRLKEERKGRKWMIRSRDGPRGLRDGAEEAPENHFGFYGIELNLHNRQKVNVRLNPPPLSESALLLLIFF